MRRTIISHVPKSRASHIPIYMTKSRAHSLPLSLPLCKIFVIRCIQVVKAVKNKVTKMFKSASHYFSDNLHHVVNADSLKIGSQSCSNRQATIILSTCMGNTLMIFMLHYYFLISLEHV